MNLIKLDAIASTNTYLKELQANCKLQNFTVVLAENQFAGKGQRGFSWDVEAGSSLTFSVFVKDFLPNPEAVFDLNILVALSVNMALKNKYELPFCIKWPNDILAVNKKIGGILIENMIKADGSIHSVIGIGLNVNQLDFKNLPNATSLAVLLGKKSDKDELFLAIMDELKQNLKRYTQADVNVAWDDFHSVLYKKDAVMTFEDGQGDRFVGIIRYVTRDGLLCIELENDDLKLYALKEIKMLY